MESKSSSPPQKPATATLIARLKREAKKAVREGFSHQQALEEGARAAGWPSWHALSQAVAANTMDAPLELLINPALPEDFDCTPNEERSKSQLDLWWDRPFAFVGADGRYEVRCLHGGAWDRSSFMGLADSFDEAKALARAKLSEWQVLRARPAVTIDDEGRMTVVRMPQRPDQSVKILHVATSQDDAARFIAEWKLSQSPTTGA